MRNNVIILIFVLGALLFLSNNDGVPQPVTGSPDESGLSCNACHSGGNFNPSIEMKLMDDNMVPVTSYLPGILYNVSVKVTGSNNPVAYGFQMVNLADSDNSDKGLWSQFGSNVKEITLTVKQRPRKYIEQSSPKINGEFLVKWTAPEKNTGKVTFYYSGLATNGNGTNRGDSHVVSKISFEENTGTSSTHNTSLNDEIKLYPNPASDFIKISGHNTTEIVIQNMVGSVVKSIIVTNDNIDIDDLSTGLYIIKKKESTGLNSYLGTFYKL